MLTLEQLREKVRADVQLAELARHEAAARLSETEPTAAARVSCALRYRELLGIRPDQRHALRSALERTRQGVGLAVADLLHVFRRDAQSNGSSSAG